mgnify:CR=1 FL=1
MPRGGLYFDEIMHHVQIPGGHGPEVHQIYSRARKALVGVTPDTIYEDDVAPLVPDPDQWVDGGARTADEMSHAWIALTHLDEEG